MPPNPPPQSSTKLRMIVSNTGCTSAGTLEITFNISAVAVCCSNASERCPRASASSRVRASSCFFNSISELGPLLTCGLAFVPVERSLRPRVGLFASLRDKVTSSAQPLVLLRSGPIKSSLSILTEPHAELAPFRPRSRLRRYSRNGRLWNIDDTRRSGLLGLDVGRPDYLGPLLDLFGDEFAAIARRAGKGFAANGGKSRLDAGIGENRVDLLVEFVDDSCRRAL